MDAVSKELDGRRREELRRSLHHPHTETDELAELGFEEWTRGLPAEDTEAFLANSVGTPIQWVSGKGWVAGRE